MHTGSAYPVHVVGRLDPRLSRGMWLVKWLLAIPHLVVLALLWIAFAVLSVAAFVAILVTGRYPRAIFDFNLGVMRWSWRVAFYSFSANGTDRYPPFTLAAVPDYPATLAIDYPQRLSRGLVLVKWWLLALPHYVIVAVFAGGALMLGWHVGLVSLLVFFAVVALLVTGRYPRSIFDLVLGMNRWAIRVAAYAGLMTDAYPPFRLDQGEVEPGELSVSAPSAPTAPAPARWGAGRVTVVVIGSLLAVASLAALAAGTAGVVIDRTQRDAGGYLASHERSLATGTYALVSERYSGGTAGDWIVPGDLIGTARIRVHSSQPVFVGIARERDVAGYLGGVRRAQVSDLLSGNVRQVGRAGGPPAAAPAARRIWAASVSGSGTRTLYWTPRRGDWRVVVMNADASAGIRAQVSVGGRFPDLGWIAWAVIGGGAVLGLASGALLTAGFRARPSTATSR